MVRLSLIVLCLLAAAWFFTGPADGLKIRTFKFTRKIMFCGACDVIKTVRCYKSSSCRTSPPFTSRSMVHCVNTFTAYYMHIRCSRRRSCIIPNRLRKGPYRCKYTCVKRT